MNHLRHLAPAEIDMESSITFANALEEVPADTMLTVDLIENQFFDSSGLAVLIRTQKRLTAGGGRVEVANPSPMFLRLLEICALEEFLPVEASR